MFLSRNSVFILVICIHNTAKNCGPIFQNAHYVHHCCNHVGKICGVAKYKIMTYSRLIFFKTYCILTIVFSQPQTGSYFGAEVCVVDLNSDKNTDLLLVSAPTYTENSREGKVFVYYYSSRWVRILNSILKLD